MAAKKYRVGADIRAPELRVLDPQGEQLGVLKLDEALKRAQEANLELVEVAPQAKPPVARIMDFGKFRYEQDKLAKQQKKVRAGLVKEIRLSMKIGEHDLAYRLKKARTFLEDGQKVKFNLMMKGRENANPAAAKQRVKDVIAGHIPEVEIDGEPTRAGRSISLVVAPPKGGFKKTADAAAEKPEQPPEGGSEPKKPETS